MPYPTSIYWTEQFRMITIEVDSSRVLLVLNRFVGNSSDQEPIKMIRCSISITVMLMTFTNKNLWEWMCCDRISVVISGYAVFFMRTINYSHKILIKLIHLLLFPSVPSIVWNTFSALTTRNDGFSRNRTIQMGSRFLRAIVSNDRKSLAFSPMKVDIPRCWEAVENAGHQVWKISRWIE